jgi:tetratricopeptide (TPR) repeat protein
VNVALGRAEQLHTQAAKMKRTDPAAAAAALAVWKQGLAAAEQAADIAASGLAGPDTARRAGQLLAELRAGVKQAEQSRAQAGKDARLLADLDAARLARSTWKEGKFDSAASAAGYARAFAAYGLDVLGPDPSAPVRALRRLPPPLKRALVVALDDWALCASGAKVRQRLRRVADGADDDPWRRRFRRAGNHLDTLKGLAVEARRRPLPAVSFDLLAEALWRGGAPGEAAALLRHAQQRYPADFWINFDLGSFLWTPEWETRDNLDEAIGYFRVAVALRPQIASVHNNLGNALKARGDLDGAMAEFRQAIALESRFALAHYNLGIALKATGKLAPAIAAYRRAMALDPAYAPAPYNLGIALLTDGDAKGATAAFRQALALQPLFPKAFYNLGNALRDRGDVKGAVAAYRRALAQAPRFAEAHCNLGLALRLDGRLSESLASYRRGHRLGTRQAHWPYRSDQWVKTAERLVELDKQLPAFLEGRRQPASAGEGLELAELCRYKRRFVAAVGFYRRAFAADPKQQAARGYLAACDAALAGGDQGRDAAPLTPVQKAELRRQALTWLRAELGRWGKSLVAATPQARAAVVRNLRSWQRDPDLAGLRARAALAPLPAAEREEWARFWEEVAALLRKARRPLRGNV